MSTLLTLDACFVSLSGLCNVCLGVDIASEKVLSSIGPETLIIGTIMKGSSLVIPFTIVSSESLGVNVRSGLKLKTVSSLVCRPGESKSSTLDGLVEADDPISNLWLTQLRVIS